MSENPIADALGAPGSRNHFHQGDALQLVPQPPGGGESSELDQAALEADRRALHAPRSRPRWGTDEDGNPIEAPASGIPWNEEEGRLMTPDEWTNHDGAAEGRRRARSESDPKPEPEPRPEPKPEPAPTRGSTGTGRTAG